MPRKFLEDIPKNSRGGKIYVPAGIVADSDPESEQNECLSKAKALFRAGEEARRFANQAGKGQ